MYFSYREHDETRGIPITSRRKLRDCIKATKSYLSGSFEFVVYNEDSDVVYSSRKISSYV